MRAERELRDNIPPPPSVAEREETGADGPDILVVVRPGGAFLKRDSPAVD